MTHRHVPGTPLRLRTMTQVVESTEAVTPQPHSTGGYMRESSVILLTMSVALTVGAPGRAMGSGDASSDAFAAREAGNKMTHTAVRESTTGVSLRPGAVLGPLGASDGATDTLATRAQANRRVSNMSSREMSWGSKNTASTAGPIGASDGAAEAFAARSRTGDEGHLGAGWIARDHRTSEAGTHVESHGSGAGEP